MLMFRGVGSRRIARVVLAALICASLAACGDSASSAAGSAAAGIRGATGATNTAAPTDSSSVTLSWSPPTQNSDGTSLSNLAGYTLHYGTSSEDYTGRIEITNPRATSYVLSDSNFPPGKYYFAISAYNAQQVSSPLSGEINVTVD